MLKKCNDTTYLIFYILTYQTHAELTTYHPRIGAAVPHVPRSTPPTISSGGRSPEDISIIDLLVSHQLAVQSNTVQQQYQYQQQQPPLPPSAASVSSSTAPAKKKSNVQVRARPLPLRKRKVEAFSDEDYEDEDEGEEEYKSAAIASKKEKKSASPTTATNGGRNKKRGKYTTFKQRLADLKAYKEKHGHINVKADEDKALYQFCASAKHSFRKSLP